VAEDRVAVRARELSAGYGERTVLGALSFDLPEDRTTIIAGPGGSGKSTLLRAMMGSRGQESDGFWHQGELSVRLGPWVYLAQHPSRTWDTVGNIIGGGLFDRERVVANIDDLWKDFPEAHTLLLDGLDMPLMEASFELARLAEFTASVNRPAGIFLLDEPDLNLAEEALDWITEQLILLRGKRTMIVVTHHLRFARTVSDFAMLLVRGELIEATDTERFFSRPEHPRAQHYVRMGS